MKSLIALVVLLSAQSAFGWGDTGHRIVGKIAENHLTPEARAQVESILGRESLARSATWADEVRSDSNKEYYGKITPLHFMEVREGTTVHDELHPHTGDILTAIRKYIGVLKKPEDRIEIKIEALRLLVHFVGDLHQPLHVGNGLDMGGNACTVKFHGQKMNLHSLWDSGMIEETKLSYTEYAEFLDIATDDEVRRMQSSPVETWAAESARIRNFVYPKIPKLGDLQLNEKGSMIYCTTSRDQKLDERFIPNLSYEYHYEYRKTYEMRLLQAGVRLAGLLNQIFAK